MTKAPAAPATFDIRYLCPDCHQVLSLNSSQLGVDASCPHCHSAITPPTEPLSVGRFIDEYAIRVVRSNGPWQAFDVLHPGDAVRSTLAIVRTLKNGETVSERAMQSASSAMAIDHPAAIPCLEIGLVANRVFAVMELIDGTSLAQLWGEQKFLDPVLVIDIMAAVADSLDATREIAGGHGILRADQIWLTRDRTIRITAPGLHRLLAEPVPQSSAGLKIQSRASADALARQDTYCLGLLAYRSLAGAYPHEVPDDRVETLFSFPRPEPPRPLLELRPDIPKKLAWMVDKMIVDSGSAELGGMRVLKSQLRILRAIASSGNSGDNILGTDTVITSVGPARRRPQGGAAPIAELRQNPGITATLPRRPAPLAAPAAAQPQKRRGVGTMALLALLFLGAGIGGAWLLLPGGKLARPESAREVTQPAALPISTAPVVVPALVPSPAPPPAAPVSITLRKLPELPERLVAATAAPYIPMGASSTVSLLASPQQVSLGLSAVRAFAPLEADVHLDVREAAPATESETRLQLIKSPASDDAIEGQVVATIGYAPLVIWAHKTNPLLNDGISVTAMAELVAGKTAIQTMLLDCPSCPGETRKIVMTTSADEILRVLTGSPQNIPMLGQKIDTETLILGDLTAPTQEFHPVPVVGDRGRILPTASAVEDGSYPLAPAICLSVKRPDGIAAAAGSGAFGNFLLSSNGQQLLCRNALPLTGPTLSAQRTHWQQQFATDWQAETARITAEIGGLTTPEDFHTRLEPIRTLQNLIVQHGNANKVKLAMQSLLQLKIAVSELQQAVIARNNTRALQAALPEVRRAAISADAPTYMAADFTKLEIDAGLAGELADNRQFPEAELALRKLTDGYADLACAAAEAKLLDASKEAGLFRVLPYAGTAGEAWQKSVNDARILAKTDRAAAAARLTAAAGAIPALLETSLPAVLKAAGDLGTPRSYADGVALCDTILSIRPGLPQAIQLRERILANNRFKPGAMFTNDAGIKLVFVPPANAVHLGSRDAESTRDTDEVQARISFSKGLFIGATEITQHQWETVLGADYVPPSGVHPTSGNAAVGPDFPKVNIAWEEAETFCRKLSEREGRRYRLPTEAEWEYACRAGAATAYSSGRNLTFRDSNIYDENGISKNAAVPVASYPPNAFGLYDMHGNAWEWCADWYGPYPPSGTIDPIGQLPPDTAPDLAKRCVRGGSWYDSADKARSANRWGYLPVVGAAFIGFRIVLEAADAP